MGRVCNLFVTSNAGLVLVARHCHHFKLHGVSRTQKFEWGLELRNAAVVEYGTRMILLDDLYNREGGLRFVGMAACKSARAW